MPSPRPWKMIRAIVSGFGVWVWSVEFGCGAAGFVRGWDFLCDSGDGEHQVL